MVAADVNRWAELDRERTRAGHPPVVLLGGRENALACARHFTRAGVTTVVIDHDDAPALRSRGVIGVPVGPRFDSDAMIDWLRSSAEEFGGSVLIPLSDKALIAIVEHDEELRDSYRPVLFDPGVVTAMLDKLKTVEAANAAGVPAPLQWIVGPEGVDEVREQLVYPLILKPVHSFEARTKHLKAHNEDELDRHLVTFGALPSGFVLNEFIPGGDEELSSYYAIRTSDGQTLLEFTKRVDRRNPPNKGGATFHELIDLPATAEVGRKFFDHIGLVGLGNVEFKRDPRSGVLKIIECNHRITAALPLMQNNGIDLAGAVYDQALGRPVSPIETHDLHGTLWYPVRDLISFRMSGEGIRSWLRRPVFRTSLPYWRFTDPRPALTLWRTGVSTWLRKRRPWGRE